MAITGQQAARRLAELSNWRLTNLALQKILYMAHMVHLGRYGEPLVNEDFQAWDYGPVLPSVYHKAKVFGSEPVRDIFHSSAMPNSGREDDILKEAISALGECDAADLVNISHWEKGAWASHYNPGGRGIRIPNDDILNEYRERMNG